MNSARRLFVRLMVTDRRPSYHPPLPPSRCRPADNGPIGPDRGPAGPPAPPPARERTGQRSEPTEQKRSRPAPAAGLRARPPPTSTPVAAALTSIGATMETPRRTPANTSAMTTAPQRGLRLRDDLQLRQSLCYQRSLARAEVRAEPSLPGRSSEPSEMRAAARSALRRAASDGIRSLPQASIQAERVVPAIRAS